jgi:carbonic anhydrase/acetyltransferase-like protein (isoleucine patch superfamily)
LTEADRECYKTFDDDGKPFVLRAFLGRIPRLHPTAFVHDSAEVIGDVVIGPRASVWPLCVLRGDIEPIRIGAGSNVQDGTLVHTGRGDPAVLGKRVTVGHGVILHGCRIEDGCLIGMGSTVLETVVGRESLVGAGALVLKGTRIPPRSLVLGSPAKVVRKVKASELKEMRRIAASYPRAADVHRKSSRPVFPA